MTLSRFIKELQKLQAAGHGRAKVAAQIDTFRNNNGDWTVCDVNCVEHNHVFVADGDGFGVVNKDGSERTMSCIVLKG